MPKIIDTRASRANYPDAELNISNGKHGIELSIQNIRHPFMVDILTVSAELLPAPLKKNQFFLMDDSGDIISMLIQQGWIERTSEWVDSLQEIPVYSLSEKGLAQINEFEREFQNQDDDDSVATSVHISL